MAHARGLPRSTLPRGTQSHRLSWHSSWTTPRSRKTTAYRRCTLLRHAGSSKPIHCQAKLLAPHGASRCFLSDRRLLAFAIAAWTSSFLFRRFRLVGIAELSCCLLFGGTRSLIRGCGRASSTRSDILFRAPMPRAGGAVCAPRSRAGPCASWPATIALKRSGNRSADQRPTLRENEIRLCQLTQADIARRFGPALGKSPVEIPFR
jgi:hypothetical protein